MSAKPVSKKDMEKMYGKLGRLHDATQHEKLENQLSMLKDKPEEIRERDINRGKTASIEAAAEHMIREAAAKEANRNYKDEYAALKELKRNKSLWGRTVNTFKSLTRRKSPSKGGKRRTNKKRQQKRKY